MRGPATSPTEARHRLSSSKSVLILWTLLSFCLNSLRGYKLVTVLSNYSIPPPFFMFYIISITQIYFLNQVMKINYLVFFAVLYDILVLNLFCNNSWISWWIDSSNGLSKKFIKYIKWVFFFWVCWGGGVWQCSFSYRLLILELYVLCKMHIWSLIGRYCVDILDIRCNNEDTLQFLGIMLEIANARFVWRNISVSYMWKVSAIILVYSDFNRKFAKFVLVHTFDGCWSLCTRNTRVITHSVCQGFCNLVNEFWCRKLSEPYVSVCLSVCLPLYHCK